MDIDAFLRARNDEDEAVANAATPGPWVTDDPLMSDFVGSQPRKHYVADCSVGSGYRPGSIQDAAHIARHDPPRVLDEVAARRRVLERHRRLVDVVPSWAGHDWANNCYGCGDPEYDRYTTDINDCPELCDQAAPFAGHPDYEERWKP